MAQTYLSRFLTAMAANERALRELFQTLANAASAELLRRADAEGNIPRAATFEIQRAVGERVTAFFLGRTAGERREPFQVLPNGVLIPLAPYPRALWQAIERVTRLPVEQHAGLLRQRLPADIVQVMLQAQRDPFAAAREVAEMHLSNGMTVTITEQVFRPNPLAKYEPPHTWVDPNGYTLSDRIWNTAGNTRRRLDLFLDQAVREGRGALETSRQLETFLLPGKQLRTKAPYGIDASYEAMRLARTEIARAHASAAEASAAMNPFVQGLKWNRSRSHPKRDICDDHAEGGPNGDGVYALGTQPNIPGDSHPQCLCYYGYQMVENPEIILQELRADILRTRAELVSMVGPLLVDRFTELLLRGELNVLRPVTPAIAG